MEEHTKRLLEECNSGCKMAIRSIDQVTEYAQDQELITLLHKYEKKHEEIEAQTSHALQEYGETGKKPKTLASAFSWFSTEMKLSMHDDSKQIAKLMMDGCNMGIQSITEYQHHFQEASKEAKGIAEKLVRMEEEFAKELKAYL